MRWLWLALSVVSGFFLDQAELEINRFRLVRAGVFGEFECRRLDSLVAGEHAFRINPKWGCSATHSRFAVCRLMSREFADSLLAEPPDLSGQDSLAGMWVSGIRTVA